MDAEIKDPSAESSEVIKGFVFKLGVSQSIALLASPAARDSNSCQLLAHSASFTASHLHT